MKRFLLLASIVLAGCPDEPKKVESDTHVLPPQPAASTAAVADDYTYLGKTLPSSKFSVDTAKNRVGVSYESGVVIKYGEIKPVLACLLPGNPSELLPAACRCLVFFQLTDSNVDGLVDECEEDIEFSCLNDHDNEAIKARRIATFAYCKTGNARLKAKVDELARAYAKYGRQTQKMLDLSEEAESEETADARCARVELSTPLATLRDRSFDAYLREEVKRITAKAIESEDAKAYPRGMTAKRSSANKCTAEATFRFTLVDEAGKALGKFACNERYSYEPLANTWADTGEGDCEEEQEQQRSSQAQPGVAPGARTKVKNAVRGLLRKL